MVSPFIFFGIVEPPDLLRQMEQNFTIYTLFILMPITIITALYKGYGFRNEEATGSSSTKKNLPRILDKQIKIILQVLILPRWLFSVIQFYPFNFHSLYVTSSYAIVGISTSLITLALYYCARKVIGLRFLDFNHHVEEQHRYNFVEGFKDTLEELGKTTSIKELSHITQAFFKEAFNVPGSRISLHIRAASGIDEQSNKMLLSEYEMYAEAFLSNTDPALEKCINKVKILIYDEIDFNNFYDPNSADQTILTFMDSINADIFLPIYKNHHIIGYIIVERHARLHEFYSKIERDEMLVFASYLGNIINLLQNKNFESLIHQEKELKEELYKKHQEIHQYKESIHSFLKNNKQKEIGVLFYKNRHFVFANQAAKEIIKINVNTNQGAPLTKALKALARQVEEFKASHSCITKNSDGERIVINGVPNLEKNQVIITAYYPDFSDIISNQIDHLKDPTAWDYLLYLETTKPGQLINQLIPGTGQHLLQFKINLLQMALSKKALLLEMASDDLLPTVELLHHISMRATLHVLTLQGPSKNFDIAVKLFGMNQIFGTVSESKPLLEKLDANGTLFIQNIEYMDGETQEHLAEFIKFGFYKIFKSTQKMASGARIICSTNQNLQTLVQEGNFSAALYNELKKATLSMPSLLVLPEAELAELTHGLAQQAIKNDDLKPFLDLSQKDKTKLMQHKPASIQELKNRVQTLLVQKSKDNNIEKEIQFDPAFDVSDPDLIQAARLGKHALRDKRIMVMLCNKFKNQNKIASFLGVNRSSVNRRCREFKLLS
jgi:transcriptional regulator of aromatic amino acid metabolism